MTYGVTPPVGFGLQPRVSLTGGAWNNQQNAYQIAQNTGNSIFTGDPVSLSTAGTIQRGPDTAGRFCGVFVGCEFTIAVPNAAGNVVFSPFWPANQPILAGTTITAFVIDDPTVEYSVQFGGIDGSTNYNTLFTQANVGQNFPIVIPTPNGSTITGQSSAFLNPASDSTGTTAHFKIVRFEPSIQPTQVITNPYVNVVGVFNLDTFKGTTPNPS